MHPITEEEIESFVKECCAKRMVDDDLQRELDELLSLADQEGAEERQHRIALLTAAIPRLEEEYISAMFPA